MEQCGDELHFHPFAQREFSNHHIQFVFHVKKFYQFRHSALEGRNGDAIDFAVQFERFPCWKVPPKLVFLAQKQGELASVSVLPLPRDVTEYASSAACWIEQ